MRRFTAVLLTRNRAMLHLFEHVGAARIASRYGDTLELEVELPFETGAPMEAIRGRGRRGARVEIPPPNALPWQPEWACAMIRA